MPVGAVIDGVVHAERECGSRIGTMGHTGGELREPVLDAGRWLDIGHELGCGHGLRLETVTDSEAGGPHRAHEVCREEERRLVL